ncbi:MAG: tRNA (N(6)-L-threonylcarbamoyladenosine(37)-C(2))-methylthiotransferase MtaB [wastewater metagenome]|nr:tRNA (N(6)-L-threonylcarbamoyladenosine(37)-C(2))-methylthiotransferase MtaB [Candidatus Loosdrechtia aerotolerans]
MSSQINLMKTCAFITLGCKVNQYETQAIRESLAAKGFVEASPEQAADIYVINTCTVTSASDEKSRQYIKRVRKKNPDATIVVTGCYAEADAETIKGMDGVDYVITKAEEARLADIISGDTVYRIPTQEGNTNPLFTENNGNLPQAFFKKGEPYELPFGNGRREGFWDEGSITGLQEDSIYDLKISHFAGHTKAFLKIEDGCDMYCSYCIIPYVRGNIKSRRLQGIKEEAERLVQNGYREIIVTGIHLGAYGKDTNGDCRLLDVVSMLTSLPGLERVRLSSIEVNEITDDLIDFISCSKKVCPHFHIPLQSGDDFILKRMNRRYTASRYLEVIDTIRSRIDLPSFTTDVMIGFPGEKDAHFENTIRLCKEAGFHRIHIFPFSVRKGTPAAKMPNYCHPQIIKERKTQLEDIANTLSLTYKKQFLNRQVEVLVETEREPKTDALCGYSERYIKVTFDGPDTIKNTITPVLIKEVTPSFAAGDIV